MRTLWPQCPSQGGKRLAARPHGCPLVPALLPRPPKPPGWHLRASSARSSSDGAPEASDSEGGPAAAAEALARLRARQAQLDAEQEALEGLQGSLDARQEALFEELEALAERERALQSLLGSQQASGWSLDAAGSGGEERQQWGSSVDESADDGDNNYILGAKCMYDGCRTLAECRSRLRCVPAGLPWGRSAARGPPLRLAAALPGVKALRLVCCREEIKYLEQMEAEGWELKEPVQDGWGDLIRQPPADPGAGPGGPAGAAGGRRE